MSGLTRAALVVLFATAACKRPEPPGTSAYGPVTPQTSITVSTNFVSDIMTHDHRIEMSGDGTLRDEESGSRTETRVSISHVRQAQLVRLLNALAAIDFLNMQCSGRDYIDHGPHPWVRLVTAAGKRTVHLDDCASHSAALQTFIEDTEKLAHDAR